MSISKYTHKILNGKNQNSQSHYFKQEIMRNRNIRRKTENKTGPHTPEIGHLDVIQKTFLYKSRNIYNYLPRGLTLIKSDKLFKIWIKRFYKNRNIKLKEVNDNVTDE